MQQQLRFPLWQGPLHAAIVELNRARLREKLDAAEVAMSKRFQELAHRADTSDERRSIASGLYTIRMLRDSRLS
jgi:hypothetical protein